MHELGVALEVVRMASEEAAAHGGGRVLSVTLRVGRWSGVEPESLLFSLTVVSEGTPLEGCRFELEPVAPELRCDACGATYRSESFYDPCPSCGGPAGALAAGDELVLASMEVEEP